MARSPSKPAQLPFISVVVPVRNEVKNINRTLRWLMTQLYPAERFEVLVADGRSTDGTRLLLKYWARQHDNIRLLDNPGRLSSCGRNAGVRRMKGEVMLLIDGHCHVTDPLYLAEVAELFMKSRADCLARPQPLRTHGATPFQRAVAAARSSFAGHNPSSHIYSDKPGFINPESSAIAYHRRVFRKIGLFDESFDACEDVEFNHRVHKAGFLCYFSPKIGLAYHPRASFRALAYQMYRYGAGRVRLADKHPDSLTPTALAPAAFMAWLAAGSLLAFSSPLILAALIASLIFYATFLAAGTLVAARQLDFRATLYLPAVFATIHAGYAWGFLTQSARTIWGWGHYYCRKLVKWIGQPVAQVR